MVALLLIRMKLAILKNNNFDNEVDQSSDDLLYMAAAETELILQDITDITEIENRNQSSTIAL